MTSRTRKTPRRRYIIRRPAQIRALTSPVRQEIVDTVQALRRCSVADIARQLGRPVDGLYYHVRTLLRADLLRTDGTRPGTKRPEALYCTASPRHNMQLHYDPEDRRNVREVCRAVGGMLRVTERDFAAAFRPGLAVCSGPARNLRAARGKVWLSRDDLREVNTLLEQLTEILERPARPGSDRLHACTYVLAPVEARDERRAGTRI